MKPTINFAANPVATGWGRTGYYSELSKALLKVTLEYFHQEECNSSYANNIGISLRNGIVPTTQVCAGSHNDTKDACQVGGFRKLTSEKFGNFVDFRVTQVVLFKFIVKTCIVCI